MKKLTANCIQSSNFFPFALNFYPNYKDKFIFRIVDNAEWYEKMSFLDFIGNIGRHFRVGNMLSLTSVRTRMQSDEGISFTEFSYQICQSYDWLQLLKNHKCKFQLGGTDQLGNISAGYNLIKRVDNKTNVFGLTIPLLTTKDGKKFGKSDGNAIWLDTEKTSPFSLYQFFVRTPDDEIENLLKMLTFFSLEEINQIMIEQNKATHLRIAPMKLAEQMTLLIHGGIPKFYLSKILLYFLKIYSVNFHLNSRGRIEESQASNSCIIRR